MKFAVIVIGASGSNSQMLLHYLTDFASDPKSARYGLSSLPIFDQDRLATAEQISVAGWDVRGADRAEGLEPGCVTLGLRSATSDTLLGDEEGGREWRTVGDGADLVEQEIREFVLGTASDTALVINLASPARRSVAGDSRASVDTIRQANATEAASAYAYLLGALQAGAHFIDFTPSPTLEVAGIDAIASGTGAQFAGRDGSTGQTYLKLMLAGALATRGLTIENWYSTNVLGNRDGQVLEIPGVDLTKMHDKAFGLNTITGLTEGEHRIDIRYMPALGDAKEAWDSVLFRDIFGNVGELQLRWKALDTPLATQSLLDLVRVFLSTAASHPPGLRRDLGFFFKHPMGTRPRTPEYMFTELLEANSQLLLPGYGRADLAW